MKINSKTYKNNKRELVNLKILDDISELSTCYKYKISSIIIKNWKIVSYWYNWTAPWIPECKEYYDFLNCLFNKKIKNDTFYIEKIEKNTSWIENFFLEKEEKNIYEILMQSNEEKLKDNNILYNYFIKELLDYFTNIWREKYIYNKNEEYTETFIWIRKKIWEYDINKIKDIVFWKKALDDYILDFNFFHSDVSTFWEIHAEQNAILFAAKEWISLEWTSIYTNYLPCIHCAKLISVSWIKKVYYQNEYITRWHNETTGDFLKAAWIELIKLDKNEIIKQINENNISITKNI